MMINNVTSGNKISSNTTLQTPVLDTESQKLQDQITDKQQNLNKITSDKEMSTEEKAKKRQEIQRQIAELNRKLRLQQMEKKEEAQKEAKETEKKKQLQEAMTEQTDTKKEVNPVSSNSEDTTPQTTETQKLPVVNIEGLAAADTIISLNQTTNQTDKTKNQRENILESEIELDTLYGTDPQSKKEALSASLRKENLQIDVIKPQKDDSPTPNTEFNGKIIIKE